MSSAYALLREQVDLIVRYHPAGQFLGSDGRTRALKFLLRTMLWYRDTLRWLRFIESSPLHELEDDVRRELGDKVHRLYARRHTTVTDRASMLIEHYLILQAAFSSAAVREIASGRGLRLAGLEGRDGGSFALVLRRHRLFHQQGELVISLIEESGAVPLATLAMHLRRRADGKAVLYLSGLQGPSAPHGRDEIVQATRALDGLRPKRAVVEAAVALAKYLNIDEIVATAKVNHVSTRRGRRGRLIHADYDGFWVECGATPLADGDFRFPLPIPRRDAADVAGKRRKDWLRRMERLDHILAGSAASLAAAAAMPQPTQPRDAAA